MCLALTLTAPAWASTVPLDILPTGDQHVDFPRYESADRSPPSAVASGLGDVDGDGIEDVAMVLDSFESAFANGAYVVSGSGVLPSVTQAGAPGWKGFRIVGDHLRAVTGLGDVNGDGRDEIAVSGYAGAAVVFGRADGRTVDITQDGDWGFRIRGAGSTGGYGFGTTAGGTAQVNTSMVDAGDQNGDGRPDLAVVGGGGVVVAYTPAQPAGAVVDGDAPGTNGFRLVRPGRSNQGVVTVSRAGDLDGDGRQDLVVAWDERDPFTSRAVGVVSPAPGTSVDLGGAVEAGTGWEVAAPGSFIENALSVGDQNGDGRRDVLLAAVDYDDAQLGGRRGLIGYAPPLGRRTTIRPPTPATGVAIDIYDGNVIDVGDQDGDGRSDLAFSNYVRHSSAGLQPVTAPGGVLGGRTYLAGGSIILATVGDRNGDGKRELVTVVSSPHRDDPPYEANWKLDIYASAPVPLPIDIPLPSVVGDALDFTGTFIAGATRAAGGRLSVELAPSGGTRSVLSAPGITPARDGRVSSSLRVTRSAGGLVVGRSYDFRLLLENGWGLVGASQLQRFTYRPSAATVPGAPLAVPAVAKAKPKRRLFVGTRRADRLVGTNGPDELRGLAGNDRLSGLGGDDRLSGGEGNDRLTGGRGTDTLLGGPGNDVLSARDGKRDTVDCGKGRRDRAVVDRRDRVRGCERVSRRGRAPKHAR